MLFCAKTNPPKSDAAAVATAAASDKALVTAGWTLPAKTADTGKIRLGGACRLPLKVSKG